MRSSSLSSESDAEVVCIVPVTGSNEMASFVDDLFLYRHPLSVKWTNETCDVQPSMNFLRTLSGTRKAALLPTKPGTSAGRLRVGVKVLGTGAKESLATGPRAFC